MWSTQCRESHQNSFRIHPAPSERKSLSARQSSSSIFCVAHRGCKLRYIPADGVHPQLFELKAYGRTGFVLDLFSRPQQ
jgi:hypothetical protein